MRQKSFDTGRGNIVYWVSDEPDVARPWLVFLPGLTADHRLFEGQIEHFESCANCLVWDAPAHGLSRPFPLDFSLEDMARWLGDVLDAEGAADPLLVGQSLGGYVAQVFDVLFPGRARGIVSVDSAPLGRSYYKSWELACLPFVTRMFRLYPWETLQKASSEGNAATEAGRAIMVAMMADYSKDEYCHARRCGAQRRLRRAGGSAYPHRGRARQYGFHPQVQRAVVAAHRAADPLDRRRRPQCQYRQPAGGKCHH